MQRIMTIRSHVYYGRFLAECDIGADELCVTVAYLPRHKLPAESRYFYSPCHSVMRWNGHNVLALETSHKVYEIWEIDLSATFATEYDATESYMASLRALPSSGRVRYAGQS